MSLKEKLGSLGGKLFILAFLYAQFFGMYASSQRGRGDLGLYVPPVAWFDSVYYWFAPAEWEEDWDVKVEALAKVMWATPAELGPQLPEIEARMREWVQAIPDDRRMRLKASLVAFCEALVDVMVSGDESAGSTGEFASEPGLVRFWREQMVVAKSKFGSMTAAEQARLGTSRDMLSAMLRAKVDNWL